MAKKQLFSALIFLIFSSAAAAQVAHEDALSLAGYASPDIGDRVSFEMKDSAHVWPLLLSYCDSGRIKTISGLINEFSGNPYIKIAGDASLADFQARNINAEILAAGTANPSAGSSNLVTSFADGLAKFLIKRAKEELFIAFFSTLQDSMKNPEFLTLFPHTRIVIQNFQSWEYANVINTIREAFDKDLKQLLADICLLRNLNPDSYSGEVKSRVQAITDFFKTQDGVLVLSAIQLGNGFMAGAKIPEIFHTISGKDYLGDLPGASMGFTNTLQFLDLISNSLKSNAPGKNYISKADFLALMLDGGGNLSISGKIYLGLLWQDFHTRQLQIGSFDETKFKRILRDFQGFKTYLTNLVSQTEGIDKAFAKLAEAKKNGEADLGPYWGSVFDNAGQFLQALENTEVIDPAIQFPQKLQKAFLLSIQTFEIAHDIAVRNYSAAIVGTLSFINQNVAAGSASSGLLAFLNKYGSFAANMVQAKNSDDAEKAIESVALPVGSSSIKKKTHFSIALNAYLGGFWGQEYLSEKKNNPWSTISGVYAPVGITISKSINFPFKDASLSLLINVIDIGAVASYRLMDDSTAKLPDMSLQNLLAPGLGLVYGFPKWPLSIGYTYQLGPALRSITAAKITTSSPNQRWQLFLAVDIPLLNFYSKSNLGYKSK